MKAALMPQHGGGGHGKQRENNKGKLQKQVGSLKT